MQQKTFNELRKRVRQLLFEDVYPEYSGSSWADGERAGTQFQDDEEESDPLEDLPVSIEPEMAVQLSTQEPPVDDPDWEPVNNKQLSKALSVLASRLPDAVVKKTYDKFVKFVDDNEVEVVELVDQGGDEEVEEVTEARKKIRTTMALQLIEQMSDWSQFKLGKSTRPDDEEEDDSWEEEEEADQAALGSNRDGLSFEEIADELEGISGASGAKQLVGRALKKLQLTQVHFPEDFEKVRGVALNYWANALVDLEALEPEEAQELTAAGQDAFELPSFRTFLWNGMLDKAYKSLRRDMEKSLKAEIAASDIPASIQTMVLNQAVGNSEPSSRKLGLKLDRTDPEISLDERDQIVQVATALVDDLKEKAEDLGSLTPGLYDRAMSSWNNLGNSTKMQLVMASMQG
jgi:hypothetical protein